MADIELFGASLSPFVEKVKCALALKKLSYKRVPIRSPGDLKRWNPQTGKMPVLKIDNEKIYDSTFILQYLDKRHPEPPLLSQDPTVAAQQRLLEDWADESLYWYGMALRWCEKNRAATTAQITGDLPAFIRTVAALVLPRQIIAQTAAQGLGRLPYNVLMRELAARLDDLVLLLGKRPFFFADRVSAADLSIHGQFTMLRSGPTPEAAAALAERPVLTDWSKRVDEATGAP